MNLWQFVKYWLWRDATHHGEFAALRRLLSQIVGKSIWTANEITPLA